MTLESRKRVKIRMEDIRLDSGITEGYLIPEQQERIDDMARDLKERGQLEPIIINEHLNIIWRGHTRYFAAKKLKWPLIEAIIMNTEEWSTYIMSNGAQV